MFEIPTLARIRDTKGELCFDDIELADGERLCIDAEKYRRQINQFEREMRRLSELVAAGIISLKLWRETMRHKIKTLHTVSYLVGIGGVENVTEQNAVLLKNVVREQYAFVDNWYTELEREMKSESNILNRALMYAAASSITLQQSVTSAIGMPTLPAYPKDHSTDCRHNCYCSWQIFNLGGGNWDCIWHYDPARDNCDQCPRRARVWNPLRIRDGVIQPYMPIGLFRRII